MQPQQHDAVVIIGPRVYKTTTWSRRDTIYLGARKIGLISLKCSDRLGRTTSLITNNSVSGRQIQWCVEQSAAAACPRQKRNLPQAEACTQFSNVGQNSVVWVSASKSH